MNTWIKICGTTCTEDGLASIAAGANALGFVFASSARRIHPEKARVTICELSPIMGAKIETFGVFVNESPEDIAEVVRRVCLTGVQLHGDEDPALVSKLRAALPQREGAERRTIRIVKSIQVVDGFEDTILEFVRRGEEPDAFLLDSPVFPRSSSPASPARTPAPRGGTGKSFDWAMAARGLRAIAGKYHCRILISGGLNPGNVAEAIGLLHPYGVDVVSGVERRPGKKDPEKLKAFVMAAQGRELSVPHARTH